MKSIGDIFFGSKTTIILLVIFAISMATATFVEDSYNTETAMHLIYKAKWFELVMVLLAVNLFGQIVRFKMLKLKKIGTLLFHLSFVLMIIGAGITRYFGYEGSMYIREGQAANTIHVSEAYFMSKLNTGDAEVNYDESLENMYDPDFSFSHTFKEFNSDLTINFKEYVPDAVETIEEGVEGGRDMIDISLAGMSKREIRSLFDGDHLQYGPLVFAFNNENVPGAIKIISSADSLLIKSPISIIINPMNGDKKDTIPADSVCSFKAGWLYSSDGNMFALEKNYRKAVKMVKTRTDGNDGVDAIVLEINDNGKKQEFPVYGGKGYRTRFQPLNTSAGTIEMAFGDRMVTLPFSIYLKDFKLERYAGSESPSSYESEVLLIDERNGTNKDYRIFMNHVLDYDGYRFFQSSYDADERGTILSVNHDAVGTWTTYIAYTLLALGFIITLINPSSRFLHLRKNIHELRKARKVALVAVLFLGISSVSFAQQAISKAPDKNHTDKFGKLLVQGRDGRFEPAQTLAIDILHKISRMDKVKTEEKGTLDGMQVMLDMLIDPEYWKDQEIIYIREKSVRDILGISGKYGKFNDFFDQNKQYKLNQFAETAFRKKQSEQNTFDKEIIKVDERANIFMMALQGSPLVVFPEQNSINNKWISWIDNKSFTALQGELSIINDDLQLNTLNYRNFFALYLDELSKSVNSNDYSRPDKILGYINTIQKQLTPSDVLPSESKINMEISYNKANIFIFLRNFYGGLSFILLILGFIDNLRKKKSKIVTILIWISVVLLLGGLLYHTYGMAVRWYLTGHAPWSNGYEALLLVAWASLIAGFSFIRFSKISLASAALLAFLMLMTAGHSSYDPQLTNLQPVLKSYWLIIHVATLTIGYGFLGSSFILGIVNLIINFFRNPSNNSRLKSVAKELSHINEMNITVGLALATIGTFLGGVWANESWGRYWGWDAKETWALIIVITYTIILHLRFIPKLNNLFAFNTGSIIGFGSVIMTFIGVNYYLSKGLHSYASGDTPVFPMWAWITIISIILLIIVSGIFNSRIEKKLKNEKEGNS